MIVASDYWTVTNQAGAEIARVYGESYAEAAENAGKDPAVRASRDLEGGFGMRRLRSAELGVSA